MQPEPISATTASPPAGEADDLDCPLCGYDLRGLPQNRCPECGHAFDPEALRRAKRERASWLFEHSSRRFRAFFATSLVSLLPIRFWRRVAAAHAIVPRRLRIWAGLWMTLPFLMLIMTWLGVAVAGVRQIVLIVGSVAPNFTPVDRLRVLIKSAERLWDRHDLHHSAWMLVLLIVWPPVTVLTLQLFRATLRSAGIRQGHLWRCVLYALPLTSMPLIAFAVTACFEPMNQPYDSWQQWLRDMTPRGFREYIAFFGVSLPIFYAVCCAGALFTLHLIVAHRQYLRLRHATAQAILSQVVAVVAAITLAFWIMVLR